MNFLSFRLICRAHQRFSYMFKCFPMNFLSILIFSHSKTVNSRTRGANNQYQGGPGGPGSGLGGPRGGSDSNVRSGKRLRII